MLFVQVPTLLQKSDQEEDDGSGSDSDSGDDSQSDSEDVHPKDQTPGSEVDKKVSELPCFILLLYYTGN